MAEGAFQTKSMKRRNIRNLALNGPARPPPPATIAKNDVGDALEIGVEFRLDLRSEDLIVLRELGAGNSGTVSKVQHTATKAVMARKVRPPPAADSR
jgi:mitogen-activated protein kinase kinase